LTLAEFFPGFPLIRTRPSSTSFWAIDRVQSGMSCWMNWSSRIGSRRMAALCSTHPSGPTGIPPTVRMETGVPAGVMQDVRAIAEAHPGSAPLELRWKGRDGVPARMRSSLRLSAAGPALSELRALLGDDRVKLVRGG